MRVLLAFSFVMLLSTAAFAQSCQALRAQLASAQSGNASAAVAKLERQARSFGCRSEARWGRHRACAGIEARLKRARSGGRDTGKVRRLRRQIERKCSAPQQRTASRPQRPRQPKTQSVRGPSGRVILHGTRDDNHLDSRAGRRGNFFSSLFGGDRRARENAGIETARIDPNARRGSVERYSLEEAQEGSRKETGSAGVSTRATGSGRRKNMRYGNARTVCVRLCDGFYFPINSNSHSDNYYAEHAMCVGRCPGADVSLYVHNNEAPVERMRSTMTGEAYVRLPTAFAYRKGLKPGCGCQPQTMIVKDLNAEETLATVGMTAKTKTASASRWTRYRAVYDKTGKQIIPSQTVTSTGLARAPKGTVAVALGSAPVDTLVAGTPKDELKAAADVTPAREVGPRFFSETETRSERAQRRALAARGMRGSSTVVRVIRLDSPDDDESQTSQLNVQTTESGGG